MGSVLMAPSRAEMMEEIESVRAEMMKLGNRYGMLHPEVQRCSQELDKLLNLYYHQEYESKMFSD